MINEYRIEILEVDITTLWNKFWTTEREQEFEEDYRM